jgi:hypothetical protein
MTWMKRCAPVLALVLVTACGDASPPAAPTPSLPTTESTEGTTPGPVVLDVTIIDGAVTPRGARVELKVGQPLTLAVSSDVADELHVHVDPEQTFKVKPGSNQRFTVTVEQPGTVAVELHGADAVIAELLVRK